jgi:hypothetical protein
VVNRVDPKAVNAAIEPEPQYVEQGSTNLRVAKVQVWLFL